MKFVITYAVLLFAGIAACCGLSYGVYRVPSGSLMEVLGSFAAIGMFVFSVCMACAVLSEISDRY